MCGISGYYSVEDFQAEQFKQALNCLTHRGPDQEGVWQDERIGLALGHRRLSVLDLSTAANQPMSSPSGRYVITYNGEIYNFRTLARELEAAGASIKTQSDTEIILLALEYWGLERCLKKLGGMFAFAIWDKQEQSLILARDAVGIKPLYYSWGEQCFMFASELKPLMKLSRFSSQELSDEACSYFLSFGYIPAPLSIFKNVYKLTPGCYLKLSLAELAKKPSNFQAEGAYPFLSPQLKPFFSLLETHTKANVQSFKGNFEQAVEHTHKLLQQVMGEHLIADVPVGGFLSAGIDSSLVVSLMQSIRAERVKTFSIGFAQGVTDEAPRARKIAAHLGTEHEEAYLSEKDLLAIVSSIPRFYDEPFADSSQIPSLFLAQMARQKVSVALSGDGGDELFAGYNRYLKSERQWNRLKLLPLALRKFLTLGLARYAPHFVNSWPEQGVKLEQVLRVLNSRDLSEFYFLLQTSSARPPLFRDKHLGLPDLLAGKNRFAMLKSFVKRAMAWDQQVYLPDDNLHKVDRASMAVGLEVRVPLLDRSLLEFSARLPEKFLHRGLIEKENSNKIILQTILSRYLPPELYAGPKVGFSVPLAQWLRGPLKAWADEVFAERNESFQEMFSTAEINSIWQAFKEERRADAALIWNLLILKSWLREYKLDNVLTN